MGGELQLDTSRLRKKNTQETGLLYKNTHSQHILQLVYVLCLLHMWVSPNVCMFVADSEFRLIQIHARADLGGLKYPVKCHCCSLNLKIFKLDIFFLF